VPKLGVFSGEEIARILEAGGFVRVRQKGGHLIRGNEGNAGGRSLHFKTRGKLFVAFVAFVAFCKPLCLGSNGRDQN